MQDLQGRFFKAGDSVAYIGFNDKIHIGKAIMKDKKLVLYLANNIGYSKLSKRCLIIN